MNESYIVKNHLNPFTKAPDPKEFELCGNRFKSDKDMNDHFTKRHENIIDPFFGKCENDKCTKSALHYVIVPFACLILFVPS